MQFPCSVLFQLSLALASQNVNQAADPRKKIENKEISALFKRSGNCAFPSDKGMVAVQTSGLNAGWAMHDDQECSPGTWCPFACPPGQLMNQWDPDVTSYTYPGSQWGGLWCNENGELEEKRTGGCCYSGTGTVVVKNKMGQNSAWCQTVLPGNEEMLIPTNVEANGQATIAVPDTHYWASTASHFYINPPGVSVDDGCKWGSTSNPYGNWAPYVAGANMDNNNNTFVKIGWNPVYLENTCPFKDTKPTWGIRITCDDGSKCNGLPCEIDPSQTSVNGIVGSGTSGAGGGDFCVVTAENGATANIEVFDVSGGSGGSGAASGSIGSSSSTGAGHAHKKRDNELTKTVYTTVTI